jgi:transposase
LSDHRIVRIAYEATGAYHRAFETAARAWPLIKVNPQRARRFAQATGTLAKTDRVDAAILARMAAVLEPEIRPVRTSLMADLRELVVAKRGLVKDRTALLNRAKTLTLSLLKRQSERRLAEIDRQIAAIEAAALTMIAADPDLARRREILKSIAGLGEATALTLIVEMPELGAIAPKQAASLAGLAPITRQSGQWRGKSFIQGGRADVRRALYMPALVAIRYNPDLKAKYDQFVAAGKPAKVAIVAVMRKLIVLANALIKQDRAWMPKLA